jgi:hypothetical protein
LSIETSAAEAQSALLPLKAAVDGLPQLTLGPAEIARLRQGQVVSYPVSPAIATGAQEEQEVAVLDRDYRLVAVGMLESSQQLVPIKVFPELDSRAG